MILDDINDIRLGDRKVVKIMLGDRMVYPSEIEKYLNIYPTVLWLDDLNELSGDITVSSNTEWEVS